jgi:conjugative transfer region lipoprotein (TIGR03751 family)
LIRSVALASISLALAACASTKESVLPQDGPSMQAIYESHMESLAARDPLAVRRELGPRALATEAEIPPGYAREAASEIDTRFPRLPNPTLVMYVFPHLAEVEGVPVPGYVTTFPMYERVEYALPGEVPPGAVP